MLSEYPTIELDQRTNPERYAAIDMIMPVQGEQAMGGFDKQRQSNPEPHIQQTFPLSSETPRPVAPYQPQFYSDPIHGDIMSYDHCLDEDGEALYQFILAQAAIPPVYLLHILSWGTHTATRTRTFKKKDGTIGYQEEKVNITDFSVYIDCSAFIVSGPVFWSLPDKVAAYRGLMFRQVEGNEVGRKKATAFGKRAFKSTDYLRINEGLPPWHSYSTSSGDFSPGASSKILREWADEYAASPKLLKKFVFKKTIHGWNPTALSKAVVAAISSTSYTGKVSATFRLSSDKIIIRLPLLVTLPDAGGGKWEVVGAAYGLKHIKVVDADEKHDAQEDGKGGTEDSPRIRTIPVNATIHGQCILRDELGQQIKVTGYREGEWFKEWEPIIKRCVTMGLQTRH